MMGHFLRVFVACCLCLTRGSTTRFNTPSNRRPTVSLSALDLNGGPQLSESALPGAFIGLLTAGDPDRGPNGFITCYEDSDILELKRVSHDVYAVSLAARLDREVQSVYKLSITCTDAGTPPLDTTVTFRLQVRDENDNAPKFQTSVYEARVKENEPARTWLLQARAVDHDVGMNAAVEYSLWSPSMADPGVAVDRHTGHIFTTRPLDREAMEHMSFVLTAFDGGNPSLASSASLYLTVLDVNDNAPEFLTRDAVVNVPETTAVGQEVYTVLADDVDKGVNGQVTFSIVAVITEEDAENPFSLSPHGVLSLTASLNSNTTTKYQLLVQASDGGNPQFGTVGRVTINVVSP